MKVKQTAVTSIYLMFLVMGFTDSAGPIVAFAREQYGLSYSIAQFISLAGFIMYGLLSVPVAMLQMRWNKVRIVGWGLSIVTLGFALASLPALAFSEHRSSFYLLLFAVLVIGMGAVFLQVAGNPIVKHISLKGRFTSNLLFAQTIKAAGTACGFIVPAIAAVWFGADWKTLLLFCMAISLLILVVFVCANRDRQTALHSQGSMWPECKAILKEKNNRWILLGGFMFIGSVVSMNSGIPLLLEYRGHDLTHDGMFWSWTVFFLPVLVGRLSGGMILRRLSPLKLYIGSMVFAAAGIALITTDIDVTIYTGSILTGLGFANIFPILFSILLRRNPGSEDACSGLMMSTIAGGAILPPLWGIIADTVSVVAAFAVPALVVCYLCFIIPRLK